MSRKIDIGRSQTIMDIAIQEYGNREAVEEIIALNDSLFNDFDSGFAGDRDLFSIDQQLSTQRTVNVDNRSDLVNLNVLRNIPNKVTTFNIAVDVAGDRLPFFADEQQNLFKDENGNFFFAF